MFAFKEKFPDWKDFPNGLRVLVVDEDTKVLNEIRCKLEGCQYVVFAFTKGDDALTALRNSQCLFHVALVEAMTGDGLDGFKILEVARHLPTILMSSTENMAVMMQGIALGAADFLQKPLSDEKLRNIWQHVVRKALLAGDPFLMESLVPVKAAVGSVFSVGSKSQFGMKIQLGTGAETDAERERKESGEGVSADVVAVAGRPASERFPAQTTAQLEPVGRMNQQDDSSSTESPGDAHGCSQVKTKVEDFEQDATAIIPVDPEENGKARETLEGVPCETAELELRFEDDLTVIKPELLDDGLDDIGLSNDIVVDGDGCPGMEVYRCLLTSLPDSTIDLHMNTEALDAGEVHDTEIGEEEALLLAEVAKAGGEDCFDRTASLKCLSIDSGDCSSGDKKSGQTHSDSGGKVNKAISGRRKMKVDWTPELHRRFVQAVEQLGVEKAIPSRILELMGVQCLTRHNIASHLQKYRSHRRHLLARETEAATWHHRKPLDPNVWARSRRDGTAWLAPHHTNAPPIQPRPSMARTPIQPHLGPHCHLRGHPLPVWAHPTTDHSGAHVWQQSPMAAPTTWQAPDGSHWQYSCVDPWGHPSPPLGVGYPHSYRSPFAPMAAFASPMTTAALAADCYFVDESMPIPMYATSSDDPELTVAAGAAASSKPSDFHPPKEILDAAISEALANPQTPLPLGLKPPSMDVVMSELHHQGLNTVPS